MVFKKRDIKGVGVRGWAEYDDNLKEIYSRIFPELSVLA